MIGWGGGRYDVFLLNIDSKLFHYLYDGSWSDFVDLGGIFVKAPKAVSWTKNRLDVFITGTNGTLYHKWSSGDGT